jgi:hypothetical protein
LSAMRSMTACEALSFSAAAALSPPAIALRTALTAYATTSGGSRCACCLRGLPGALPCLGAVRHESESSRT